MKLNGIAIKCQDIKSAATTDNLLWLWAIYVTGFAKRGLPQTSNSMNLEDHNLVFNKDKHLKFPPTTNLCWNSLLTISRYELSKFIN